MPLKESLIRRKMKQLDIDPARPEFGIAKRIMNNGHFRKFLLAIPLEVCRRQAYDALAPLVQFKAKPFDILTAEDS